MFSASNVVFALALVTSGLAFEHSFIKVVKKIPTNVIFGEMEKFAVTTMGACALKAIEEKRGVFLFDGTDALPCQFYNGTYHGTYPRDHRDSDTWTYHIPELMTFEQVKKNWEEKLECAPAWASLSEARPRCFMVMDAGGEFNKHNPREEAYYVHRDLELLWNKCENKTRIRIATLMTFAEQADQQGAYSFFKEKIPFFVGYYREPVSLSETGASAYKWMESDVSYSAQWNIGAPNSHETDHNEYIAVMESALLNDVDPRYAEKTNFGCSYLKKWY